MPRKVPGREYYGPALSGGNQLFYSEEEQRQVHPTSSFVLPRVAGVGLGVAGLIGSGFIPIGKNEVMLNKYVRGLRAIEEFSPGGMLRTFQLSQAASMFEAKESVHFSPKMVGTEGRLEDYFSALLGPEGYKRAQAEGLTFKTKGKGGIGTLFYGKGTDVAKKYAVLAGAPKEIPPRVAEAAFRQVVGGRGSLGKGSKAFFEAWKEGLGALWKVEKLPGHAAIPVAADTLADFTKLHAGMFSAEMVGRFNRLFEVFGLSKAWDALTRGKIHLGVDSFEPAGKMAKGLLKKYGLLLPAAYLGYETLDYLGRETIGEGPTDLVADTWTGANVAISSAAEITGLHDYREKQEEIAPGSTSLSTLAAFPVMGATAGAAMVYGTRVKMMATLMSNKNKGGPLSSIEARLAAEKSLAEWEGEGFIQRTARKFLHASGNYSNPKSFLRKIAYVEKEGEEALTFKGLGKIGPGKLFTLGGAAIGLALVAPFIPGALIPGTRPDELRDIYSGKKEIAVKKGRWWEFGKSAWEGTKTMYYRPHWYPLMKSRAREKAIWGENEPSPIMKFIKKEFTYDVERMHYQDRPYPITAVPFEDTPLIGPILAGTIGRLIKPPQLMHQEEWMGTGNGAVDKGPGFGGRIASEMGESPMGQPISPYSAKGIFGEQMYRLTEMVGLPGFTFSSIKQAVTGSESFFEEERQLESARNIAGYEREYWDKNIGGGLGTTEAFRRLFPHKRRQIERYNPIRNTMPEWLPGEAARGPDLQHGDPYAKIHEGEIRLPGRGYEARFPELEGIAPSEYPMIHRFKILADIAPYSDEYKEVRTIIKRMRRRDDWTEYEEEIYTTTKEQLDERKSKQFQEYKALSSTGGFGQDSYYSGTEASSSTIAKINKMLSSERGKSSNPVTAYWEMLSHNAETALDQMTPFSPAAKFIHQRTAVEDYERMQVFGTQNSFWNHPYRNFLKPSFNLAALSLGEDSIPSEVRKKRSVEKYFDILKYVKYTRLSNMASIKKDIDAKRYFEDMKDQTMFGLNPYTENLTDLYRAMPGRERDYFEAFSQARTSQEKKRILRDVPENMRNFYKARWRMNLAEDAKKAAEQGRISPEKASKIFNAVREESASEGLPRTKALLEEYQATRSPGEGYADWYRRTKLLSKLSHLPGPNWVGWHASVDLEDVKLKLVENMGEDMHDYNLWPSRAARMVNKPYINDEAVRGIQEYLEGEAGLGNLAMGNRVNASLYAYNINNADTFTRSIGSPTRASSVTINYEQEQDFSSLLKDI